jgi:hypothetical protein
MIEGLSIISVLLHIRPLCIPPPPRSILIVAAISIWNRFLAYLHRLLVRAKALLSFFETQITGQKKWKIRLRLECRML